MCQIQGSSPSSQIRVYEHLKQQTAGLLNQKEDGRPLLNICRIASSEEYIPLDAALPPAGTPDMAAMAAARQALASLQVAGKGTGLIGEGPLGGTSPINGPSGAGALLSQLLASSQLPPSLPPTPQQVGVLEPLANQSWDLLAT